MGLSLEFIRFDRDYNAILGDLDTFCIKQIKAIVDCIMDIDNNEVCNALMFILKQKVDEVDECMQRLLREKDEYEAQEPRKATWPDPKDLEELQLRKAAILSEHAE